MMLNLKFLLFNAFLFLLFSHFIYCENNTNSTVIEYNNNNNNNSNVTTTEIINTNKTDIEKCLNDTDCASSKCDTVKQVCIKEVENQVNKNETESENSTNYTLYIVIGISIVVGIILFGIIFYVCTKSAQFIADDPDIQEFRESNKPNVGTSILIGAAPFI